MGQYARMQVITREFRKDAELDVDTLLAAEYLEQVREAGYTPAGDPALTWYKITQGEIDFDNAIGGMTAGYRAGDWRVRAVINVAEDEELPART